MKCPKCGINDPDELGYSYGNFEMLLSNPPQVKCRNCGYNLTFRRKIGNDKEVK